MTSLLTKTFFYIGMAAIGLGIQLAGLLVLAQAFPGIAATVWQWITSQTITALVTGFIGWIIYGFGTGWNRGVMELITGEDE